MGIISKILPLAAIGVGLLFLGNIFSRPAEATEGATALGKTGFAIGSTLSSIGGGAADLGSGVGSGLAGLFQPFWEIKNLMDRVPVVYNSSVAGAANTSPVAQITGLDEHTHIAGRTQTTPSSSTITWSSGTTATVPTLSAAAKSFYAARGVSVT